MKLRIITGIIIALLLIPMILLSDTWIFNIIIAFLSGLAAFEIIGCVGQRKKLVVSVPAVLYCIVLPFIARLSYGFIASITSVFMFYCFFISVFTNDEIDTQSISLVFACSCYVGVCFSSLVKIRYIPDNGFLFLILVFVGAWVTDIFAYFTGWIFGKHKLIPKISPKKTVEGALGGIIFCGAAFALFGYITQLFLNRNPNYIALVFIGFVVSFTAQLGDLTMSAIKRNYGVKDYGRLFPGHGGVLDRFDSILVVCPFLLMLSGNPEFIAVFK